jgi:hypothetical protein
MVLVRDVPSTIRVRGHDRLSAAIVLDVATGLVRGVAIGDTVDAALDEAFETALSTPVAELPPGWPQRLLCPPGFAPLATQALRKKGGIERTSISEVQPGEEAEDIFDSFLGHMAGRAQPEEFPTPADWRVLIERAAAFRDAEPWLRWSDERDLVVELRFAGSAPRRYTAVVMGQAGVQRGLVLYPGDELPAGLREDRPLEEAPPPPAGTLLFTLEPVDEPPVEFTAKAIRYGWPPNDELVPVFMTFTRTGAAEIGQQEAVNSPPASAQCSAWTAAAPGSPTQRGRPFPDLWAWPISRPSSG